MSERRYAREPVYEHPHYEAIFDVGAGMLIWRCRECGGMQQGTIGRDFTITQPPRRTTANFLTRTAAADSRSVADGYPELVRSRRWLAS